LADGEGGPAALARLQFKPKHASRLWEYLSSQPDPLPPPASPPKQPPKKTPPKQLRPPPPALPPPPPPPGLLGDAPPLPPAPPTPPQSVEPLQRDVEEEAAGPTVTQEDDGSITLTRSPEGFKRPQQDQEQEQEQPGQPGQRELRELREQPTPQPSPQPSPSAVQQVQQSASPAAQLTAYDMIARDKMVTCEWLRAEKEHDKSSLLLFFCQFGNVADMQVKEVKEGGKGKRGKAAVRFYTVESCEQVQ
jgi:hypothetical protein